MPNCHDCTSCRSLPGNAHIQCDKGVSGLFNSETNIPKIKGNQHGIKNGWFFWPLNYDPVWLESCDSFEMKVAK